MPLDQVGEQREVDERRRPGAGAGGGAGAVGDDGAAEFAECIGMCEVAPAVLINDVGRGPFPADKVDPLLDELKS